LSGRAERKKEEIKGKLAGRFLFAALHHHGSGEKRSVESKYVGDRKPNTPDRDLLTFTG